MPIVSVIIPVYKVEPYLRRCVNSVLAQSFQDIEIILVDDGSPDNCGAICDEYAAKDPRVQVIHQENGGLSAARNTGIRASHAEYLMFVDSDDWIAPEMAEDMLRALLENKCDMAICQYYTVRGENVICRTSGEQGIRVFDQREAMRLLIEDRLVTNHVWRRLYKKELFSHVLFPEGRAYEDIFVMGDITLQCQHIVYLDKAYYYYFTNSAGIVAVKTVDSLKDNLDGILHLFEVVEASYPAFIGAWYASFIKKNMILLRNVLNIPARTEGRTVLLRYILDELAAIPHASRKGYSREEKYCCFAARFPIPVFLVLWRLLPFFQGLVRKLRRIKAVILSGIVRSREDKKA